MIVRGDDPALDMGDVVPISQLNYSDAGGLTQFGAYVETLLPGEQSSERHWHEESDEMLYMLSGEATVVEDDGDHPVRRGDAACWKAGTVSAHQVVNRSDSPCTYLIFGTRMARDTVHYPESGAVLRDEDGAYELRAADGTLLDRGEDRPAPSPRTGGWMSSGNSVRPGDAAGRALASPDLCGRA